MKNAHHENYPDAHHDIYSKTIFGFWVYLLTDFILFGTIFATYAVLRNNTFGGPAIQDLFHPPCVLLQTFLLLSSSFTAGMGGAYAHRKDRKSVLWAFFFTFLLGALFLWLSLTEMERLIHAGFGWQKSGFLSAYFTLIGTHSLHLLFALLWTLVLAWPVYREGVSFVSVRRLTCLKMFWQFLNVVWIFIFSFVYLMGVK